MIQGHAHGITPVSSIRKTNYAIACFSLLHLFQGSFIPANV